MVANAAAEKARATASGGTRRVLLFPLPFQGHLNPMLQLADVLHARGFHITVFHAAFNAPDPVAGYRFVPVGAGVPAADLVPTGSDGDFAGALLRINERLQGAFQDCLREEVLLEEEEEEGARPACLVLDSNLRGMQVVAGRLGVPTLVLRTGGAACLAAYMAFPALCDKGLLPPKDHSQLNMPLDDLPPLRLQDMIFSTTTPHETMTTCLERIVESAKCSSGVILNTFTDLEDVDIQKIIDGVGVPVYAIGPLYKISSGLDTNPNAAAGLQNRRNPTVAAWLQNWHIMLAPAGLDSDPARRLDCRTGVTRLLPQTSMATQPPLSGCGTG
ncbi:hypothetical protein ZWY2020_026422 [Hordeum vulgare]|nr:hypothetical protein ZWY2020_026422 [Hordeum vulgare]